MVDHHGLGGRCRLDCGYACVAEPSGDGDFLGCVLEHIEAAGYPHDYRFLGQPEDGVLAKAEEFGVLIAQACC